MPWFRNIHIIRFNLRSILFCRLVFVVTYAFTAAVTAASACCLLVLNIIFFFSHFFFRHVVLSCLYARNYGTLMHTICDKSQVNENNFFFVFVVVTLVALPFIVDRTSSFNRKFHANTHKHTHTLAHTKKTFDNTN